MSSKRNEHDLEDPEFMKHLERLWHKYILRHKQWTWENDGKGGPRTECFCKGDDGNGSYWDGPAIVWYWR